MPIARLLLVLVWALISACSSTKASKNAVERPENWRVLEDKELSSYVARVGERVRAQADIPPVRYLLVDTPVVEAGSFVSAKAIYLTRGMLVSMKNEAELACLLGHELHHQRQYIDEKNGSRSLEQGIARGLKTIALRSLGFTDNVEEIVEASYSRERETEADEQGARLCMKAGYSPRALADLLGRLSSQVSDGLLERVEKVTGSHEGLADRSAHLMKMSAQLGSFGGRFDDAPFGQAIAQAARNSDFSSSQKQTLSDLDRLGTLAAKPEKLRADQVIQIVSQLSLIVQKEGITPRDLHAPKTGGLGAEASFMEERIVNPRLLRASYRDQVLSRVRSVLLGLSRIVLGVTPYAGSAIDLYELVRGRDLFTGEKLSFGERVATAVGLLAGQGGNLRKLEQVLLPGLKNSAEVMQVLRAAESEAKALGIERGVRHGPLNPGRLNELKEAGGKPVAENFRGGSYTSAQVDQPQRLFRVQSAEHVGSGELRRYWTRTKPTGPTQAGLDSALDPKWGNKGTHWIEIEVPKGTTIYEGSVASQRGIVGGGNQVFIERVDPSWILNQGAF